MKQIPNLFTLLNLVFGCLAIVAILPVELIVPDPYGMAVDTEVPNEIWMASVFIGMAAVVDFLDGFVARLFKAESEMGKQLDSLADVVSFGVAPSLILYQFLRISFAQNPDGLNVSGIWLIPAFILAGAAAWRLAKFNLDTSQQFGFKGVPTPAVGLLVASFPLIFWDPIIPELRGIFTNQWIIYGIILLLSWLMVSNLPLLSFKFKDYSLKNNTGRYLLIIIAILAGIFLKWLAVPVVFVSYVLVSLIFKQRTA